MNLIILAPEELDDAGQARLDGRRGAHLVGVLGAGPGRILRVGVLGLGLGDGEVEAVEGESVRLRVRITEPLEPPPAIDLLLALPRPPTLKKVLQQAAAMGVGRIDLVRARRVEKSYFQSPQLRPERLEAELILGLEQGRAARMPQVEIHPRLRPFMEDVLPGLLPPGTVGILGEPGAPARLWDLDLRRGAGGRALLAIGPEGGWVEEEVTRLTRAGLTPISMGARPLRVETAVVAMMAQVQLLLGA